MSEPRDTEPRDSEPREGEPRDDQVVLLDCGDGRRLDRFGGVVLDRPAPAVDRLPPTQPRAWRAARGRWERGGGWIGERLPREPWPVSIENLTLELRLTDTGQVGLFPEHVTLWRWVARRAEAKPGLRLLNLFAYTGGLTLAAARAGASVAHVDGSRTAVAWARRNAELSGLADSPIRWIAEDAETFALREVRRGRRYDGIVLDPPSYGHGGKGAWRLEERLPDLLRTCAALLDGGLGFIVLTAHTQGWDGARLGASLLEAFPPEARRRGAMDTGNLSLPAVSGAVLPAGWFARWRRDK